MDDLAPEPSTTPPSGPGILHAVGQHVPCCVSDLPVCPCRNLAPTEDNATTKLAPTQAMQVSC